MIPHKTLIASLIATITLAACLPGTPAPATSAPPTATVPAATTATSAPATIVPTIAPATVTAAPTAMPPTAGPAELPPVGYRDDRSSAVAVVESYVNALNRQEYARAYSYWEANAGVEPFAEFKVGFADTEAVTLTTGPLGGEGAAGNLFYTVPATLHTTRTDGNTQTFVGCYILHLAQPAVQGTPPFQPLAIRSASFEQAPAGADLAAQLGTACPPAAPLTPTPPPAGDEVGATYYIDDRSDPVAVLRSLFNAINRREYLRAYSYWQAGAPVGSFADFAAGYGDTATVELVTGEASSDVGAGQIYYLVPVTLQVRTTAGAQELFVGCYSLHLSNPGIQSEPPYVPMYLRAANVRPAAAESDADALMAGACAMPPQ